MMIITPSFRSRHDGGTTGRARSSGHRITELVLRRGQRPDPKAARVPIRGKRRPKASGVLAAFTVLAGCSGGAMHRAPRPGDPVPSYQATTLQGQTVTLASLHGTPFLLNFWATWCTPCQEETPFLESVFGERSSHGLRIIGVSMDTGATVDQIRAFAKKYGVTYTVLHDPAMNAMKTFGIPGLPATFLVNRQGVIQWMRFGALGPGDKDLQAALNDVLQ